MASSPAIPPPPLAECFRLSGLFLGFKFVKFVFATCLFYTVSPRPLFKKILCRTYPVAEFEIECIRRNRDCCLIEGMPEVHPTPVSLSLFTQL